MSPRVATRHAESVRHVGSFGIEEIPGLISEEPLHAWRERAAALSALGGEETAHERGPEHRNLAPSIRDDPRLPEAALFDLVPRPS